MGEAYFYHMTTAPLEVTLPALLTRARAAGWRIAVRGTDASRLDWLDQKLWINPTDGFLPHGIAGGPFDADQPILLTDRGDIPNQAECLMAIDGAPVGEGEVGALARVCILFDGNDPDAVQAAREQWKTLTAAGCAAQYWAQEGSGWKKKAESGA